MAIRLLFALVLTLPLLGDVHKMNEGPCCLCECMAKDQSTCAAMCIRMQHGKKIVEYPEIRHCTKICKHKGVKPLPKDYFQQYD